MKQQAPAADASAVMVATSDGGGGVAAKPQNSDARSAGIFKRTAAEFLGAIGFVSMFAVIGSALIPTLATLMTGATLAAGVATTALATAGIGLVLAGTAMAGSAALKKSMENDARHIQQADAKQHASPTQVIVNNLQFQPNVDIEAEAKIFTKMIEAERIQLAHKQTER
ncbi:MAG: hypothetical protein AB7L92_07130 [Alphaproteobacteria bacterium]